MARSLEEIRRKNLFVKSSTDDFQDPVFLTFRIDFFPSEEYRETYPFGDGLTNSCLLKPVASDIDKTGVTAVGDNKIVEYPTIQWLNDYYSISTTPKNLQNLTPAAALARFRNLLEEVQDSPWYFQSIQGIGDLWKALHRVKEGNQKTSLTINCIDSVKQPLTELAEMYRYAIYDNERLSYRVPDNMRWFDMVIDLIEIRDIADYSGQFFQADSDGNLNSGLRMVQFRCKMCEFDFSNFLGGSQSDHKIYTEEKPFSPSFGINVGWVIQEPISLRDAYDYRQLGMFAGALGTLNNRISRFIQNATRLPAAIVGSVLNEIQTMAEVTVMGNVYSGANAFLNDMNNISGELTGRTPPVGPPLVSNLGEDVYPTVPTQPVQSMGRAYVNEQPAPPVANMGDLYQDVPAQEVSNIGDIYEPVQPTEVNNIGDVYPTEPPAPPIAEMGDTYEDIPPTQVSEIGDIYQDEPPAPTIGDMGDVYQDVPPTQVSEIGDVYPDQPPAPAVSDMGDIYQDVPGTQVEEIGDVYPDEPAAPSISDMGDTYPDEPAPPSVAEMGDAYPVDEATVGVGEIGSTYPDAEKNPEIGEIGDAYPIDEETKPAEELGDVYQDVRTAAVASIGDVYQQNETTEPAEELGTVYPSAESGQPVGELGDVYQDVAPTSVDSMGDAYQIDEETQKIDDLGEIYKTQS